MAAETDDRDAADAGVMPLPDAAASGGPPAVVPSARPGLSPVAAAALFAIAGFGVLTVMDGLIKELASRYPAPEVALLRFICGLIAALMAALYLRPGWPARETIFANLTRSVVVAVTAVSFFYGLGVLPLGEAVALSFVSPFFTVLLGRFVLYETLDGRIGLGLLGGFLGMLAIVGGRLGAGIHDERALWGAAAVVLSAFTYSLSTILLRSRATRDPIVTIVIFHSLGPAFILLLPAYLVWVPPTSGDLMLALAVGTLGATGHSMLGLAFKRAEAARLAPLEYTALAWAVVIGYFAFGEVPSLATLAGAALIVAGAWAASHR
ncbi:MAG: DMT family transporter [Hyphomicrobiaceae bacterium]